MSIGFTTFDTAIGTCGIAWRDGKVVATCLPEPTEAALEKRLVAKCGDAERSGPPQSVRDAIDAIIALLSGGQTDLAFVSCDYRDLDDFRIRIYEATRSVPPGATATYGEIAERLGNRRFAQAVGQAMGANPLPIIVPCHRIMGSAGKLTGFSAHGGVATKVRMLEIEGALSAAQGGLFDDLPLAVNPAVARRPSRPRDNG